MDRGFTVYNIYIYIFPKVSVVIISDTLCSTNISDPTDRCVSKANIQRLKQKQKCVVAVLNAQALGGISFAF
jgi:hypothetical protein